MQLQAKTKSIFKSVRLGLRRLFYLLFPLGFWLLLWALASHYLANPILLVSPQQVGLRLLTLVREPYFLRTILLSSLKISCGFALAFALATLLALAAKQWRWLGALLKPLILLAKAVPVASLIILLLLWLSSARLSIAVSFLMVLPLVYSNVSTGLSQFDQQLNEMAEVFAVPRWRRLRYLYFPQLLPYIIPASRTAFGFAFKSGIAAEVIALPDFSIGDQLYRAKVFLDTESLFAWTVVILLLSYALERCFIALLNTCAKLLLHGWRPVKAAVSKAEPPQPAQGTHSTLSLHHVTKSYPNLPVLTELSLSFARPGCTAIVGESGRGKTTLLRLLAGLEKAEAGDLSEFTQLRKAMVFQEDRLIGDLSPWENLLFVTGRKAKPALARATAILAALELSPWQHKAVSQLSGGMQRRVALGRALITEADLVLLDEPFKGLDAETKAKVIANCQPWLVRAATILVTHDETEIAALAQTAVPTIINL